VLVAIVLALVGSIGLAVYTVSKAQGDGSSFPTTSSSPTSRTCANGELVASSASCSSAESSSEPAPSTVPRTSTGPRGIADCEDPARSGCTAVILQVSRAAWPAIADLPGCEIKDSTWATADYDLFSTLCETVDVFYLEIWRSFGAGTALPVVADFAARTGSDVRPFTLNNSVDELGQWVEGSWIDGGGDFWYSCVAEYSDYPVAMIILGHDETATATACVEALYNNDSEMRAALG
jgi:hypothetical protein